MEFRRNGAKKNSMEPLFNFTKPVAIGSDHAGFEMKAFIISFLEGKGMSFKDFGPITTDSVDYPDFAHPVADAVESGECSFGILLCGSGNGVAMTANKHLHIRAALCWDDEIAALARKHNNANVLCIPARFVSEDTAEEMVDVFIDTPFEGGRHCNRVDKIGLK